MTHPLFERARGEFSFPVFTRSSAFKRIFSLLLVMFVFALTGVVYGQSANGSISGRVTDPSGAVVSDAPVTLTQTETGLILHAITNTAGLYSFPSLGTGPYRVEVARTGFRTVQTSLTLTVAQNATADVVLQVGGANETVNIDTSTGAQLDTQDSNLNYTVNRKQVSDLPLNGRNPYGLAALSPGIAPGNNFGAGVSTARGAVVAAATNNFQTNGGIGGSNEILLDGVSIIVCCQGQPPLTPSVEVVDQFKVITSIPPAQLGRTSGGILNIVTKSGTNQLHGDVYEYLRNDKLDAAPFFTKRSGIYPIPGRNDFRAPHRFNQFGGFVSGPVVIPGLYHGQDRTFFTFGYEGIRNTTSSFVTTTVPTALQRAGVFTEAPDVIGDPFAAPVKVGSTLTRALLPAGCNGSQCFPAGKGVTVIDSVAQKLLQFWPLPNGPGVLNNYSFSKGLTDSATQYNFRLDHVFSDRDRAFMRGARDVNNHHENDLFNQENGPAAINQALTAYLFALGNTYTVSPSLVIQTTYGFAAQRNGQYPVNLTGYKAGDYGFSSQFESQQQIEALPYFGISGYAGISQAANFNQWHHYTHALELSAILQRGKHNLTVGFDGRMLKEMNGGLSNGGGSFSFDSSLTNPKPTTSVASGQGQFDALAAFLLGVPTGSNLARQSTQAFTQIYQAYYVQDDWRVLPNLTVNLGARWDIDPGFKERYNRWSDFDPNAANPLAQLTGLNFKGGAQFLGSGSNPSKTWKTFFNHVTPRVGFALTTDPSTVFRGGYGIVFLPSQRIYGAGTMGYSVTTSVNNLATATPSNTLADPFSAGVALPSGASLGVQANTGSSVSALVHDQPDSYQQQWNFGLEHSITSKLTMYINYAGGHGVHLPVNYRPNDLLPSSFGAPGDQNQVNYLNTQVPNPFAPYVSTGNFAAAKIPQVQLLSAFPQYGLNGGMASSSVTYDYYNIGSTSFNGLQTGLQFRGSSLNGTVFYTWSKLLGNVSDIVNGFLNTNGNPGIQNFYFWKQYERSNLATDIPHRIVGSLNYSLPFGRGQRFGANMSKWEDLLAGGWKLNSIVSVQSGNPLNVTQAGGAAYSGSRPTFASDANPLTHGSTNQRLGLPGTTQGYFNASAFRLSRSFELGNVPRNSAAMRSPLTFQDDLSVLKDFNLHEAFRIQFRLEAFNVLNHVQFGPPNATFNSASFGTITSQANLPRNVQAALKLFF